MSKILIFLLLTISIVALPIIETESALAYKDYGDIRVDHDPKPITVNDNQVTFTVTTSADKPFGTDLTYSYAIWVGDPSNKAFCSGLDTRRKPDSTGTTLIFTWKVALCKPAEPGTLHFVMWVGERGINLTPSDAIIVPDYTFRVEQGGGGELNFEPVKSTLGLSETPQIRLFNARKDNTYEFWWNGSKTEFALKKRADNDGNFIDPPLDLLKNGVDFTTTGQRRLCMEISDDRWPSGVTCRLFKDFKFTNLPQPTPTSQPPGNKQECTIYAAHLPDPAKDDSVSTGLNNLSPSQRFTTILVRDGQEIKSIDRDSNNKGQLVVSLSERIEIGSYTVNIFSTSDNTLMCTKNFSVTENGSEIQTKKCGRDITCTLAGGEPCETGDNRGPGFITAIGCVHTNPAEFVKDFMKWVLGIGGGLAFLMMLMGAFQMLTSAGNPETLNAGKDRLTSAIIGLLMVIFAILLFQIIGFGILKIPGFG